MYQALHQSFNSAHNRQVNTNILDEILFKPVAEWLSFSKKEFKSAISKYNNSSASKLDKIFVEIP